MNLPHSKEKIHTHKSKLQPGTRQKKVPKPIPKKKQNKSFNNYEYEDKTTKPKEPNDLRSI